MNSEKYHSYLDLVLIIAYMTVFTVILNAVDNTELTVILGLPFIFILPGYLMMLALYPRRHTITIPERIALTLGLSVIILPGIGMLLNFTPFGIKIIPIMAGTLLVSVLFCILALYQRSKLKFSEQFLPHFDLLNKVSSLPSPKADNIKTKPVLISTILKIGIIASLLGIIFMFYMLATHEQPHEHFTELSILDKNGRIIEKPWELESNRTYDLTINIINHESEQVDYSLYLRSIPFTEQWTLNTSGDSLNVSQTDLDSSPVTEITASQIADAHLIEDFQTPLEMNNNTFIYNFTLADKGGLDELISFRYEAEGFYQFRVELFTSISDKATVPVYWGNIIIFVS